jgi:hypothetical protein
MVYGELGRYPIDIDIKVRTISYAGFSPIIYIIFPF